MRGRSAPSAFNRTNTIQCFDVWSRRTAQLCPPSLCNFHPAGHSIKHGQFRLFDSGDGVVDSEPGFPLEVIGVLFRLALCDRACSKSADQERTIICALLEGGNFALPFGLFGLFQSLTLAQAHAGAAPVLVDEFDASSLESKLVMTLILRAQSCAKRNYLRSLRDRRAVSKVRIHFVPKKYPCKLQL